MTKFQRKLRVSLLTETPKKRQPDSGKISYAQIDITS